MTTSERRIDEIDALVDTQLVDGPVDAPLRSTTHPSRLEAANA